MSILNPVFDDDSHISVDDLRNIPNILSESIACENPFPIDEFPHPFFELIIDTNKALNYPVDYTGTAIISAVSTAIGKSAKICVKNGWFEYPAMYLALVGHSGAAKSHPIDTCFKVFRDLDRKAAQETELHQTAYQNYMDLTKKEKEFAEKPENPVVVKTILDNFTPEILQQRLADNTRSCTVVNDELATFFDLMNNYSKGDLSSSYLSFWSNKPISIDRVSKPLPLFIPHPFLNIIGSLQPRVLGRIFPTTRSDNGFLQRFLFAYIPNASKAPITDNEIDTNVLDNYNTWIHKYIQDNPVVLDSENGNPRPKLYYWTEEAKVFFYNWQRNNTDQVNQNKNTLVGEMLNKFDIHFIRLALIMQVIQDYKTNQITISAVKASARLCKYFTTNAIYMLGIIEKPAINDILPDDKRHFYNELPNPFTTAEAIELGFKHDLKESAINTFITHKDLFTKVSHGKYSKK